MEIKNDHTKNYDCRLDDFRRKEIDHLENPRWEAGTEGSS